MATLQLLLVIGVSLYSLYSLIAYSVRRVDNKGQLNTLKHSATPIRTLTASERADVGPFLFDPFKRGKAIVLLGDEVFRLDGEFVRHGLHVSNGGDTMHDTLGGVDVVLPYDARDFLTADNQAEVVLTPKFAIVIRLNKHFDLAGGRERAKAREVQAHQWQSGAPGEVAGGQNPAVDAAPAAVDSHDPEDIERVRILGQREETPAEAAARATPGWGGLPLLALLPASILLLIAGHSDTPWLWLVPALLLFALVLWLVWGPRKPAVPQKVNRVEGRLTLLALQNPGNSNLVTQQLFLGDKFPLQIPAHWAPWAKLPPDSKVTLEMRVEDYSVVRFGTQLAIDAEGRRFPSVYWGRHCSLALAGALLLGAAWLFTDEPAADLAHGRSALQPVGSRDINSLNDALAHPPALGSLVRIRANVRCQIGAAEGDAPPPIDCDTVRWGGKGPQLADVVPGEALQRLASGKLLQARSDPMLDLAMQVQMAREGDAYNPLAGRVSVQVIHHLSELVLGIDQECKNSSAQSACESLRTTLGSKLMLGDGDKDSGWDVLLAKAKDGSLKRDYDDAALANQITVSGLLTDLNDLATPRLREFYAKPLAAARASQRGGLLLITHGAGFPPPVTANAEDLAEAGSDAAEGEQSADWQVQWANYKMLAEPVSLKQLDLQGLVVSSGRNAAGDQVLEVDPQRTTANALAALVRLLAMGMGAALLLVHGGLWLYKLRGAMARSRALQLHLARTA
ncbi:IgaA/UmoB family intracellular growth attenuator [Chitinolyticbacter albus]|uniref:IgaA/UmoB family intracellular growth attenuator n=1 Tax=Chitinolyticbacter albus TaxID=2961951 RepID=UPI00210E9C0D|nr:IgaA/UmoB family intracellular growth attenuator [Chitinolyticbacter albus]